MKHLRTFEGKEKFQYIYEVEFDDEETKFSIGYFDSKAKAEHARMVYFASMSDDPEDVDFDWVKIYPIRLNYFKIEPMPTEKKIKNFITAIKANQFDL